MGKHHCWPSDKKAKNMENCKQCGYEAEDISELDTHKITDYTNFEDITPSHSIVYFVNMGSKANVT